jgi:ABC-2 type transport system permease protein
MAYAAALVSEFNSNLAVEQGFRPGVIDGRTRVWFNPQLESRNFMVPGVIALLLLVITANLSSMAIVRERELGTLEQLNVTPLSRWELILGKLLPYALVGFLDVLLVMTVAVYWFEVPLRGSVWLLLGGSIIYLVCTFGLGLCPDDSPTQQQAMLTRRSFFSCRWSTCPVIFPIENMPRAIQAITTLVLLRHFPSSCGASS